jgi:hypothetical protein
MNFIEAVNLLNTHTVKAVRKFSWKRFQYIFHDIDSGFLKVVFEMNADQPISMILDYSPTVDEILSNDWEIYEEKKIKLHTFEEAITAFKEGKIIWRVNDEKYSHNREYTDGRIFYYGDAIADDWIIKEKG